jgi:GH25 family lysozyme M1 (1,4-beta-N-acetylmuramidase)
MTTINRKVLDISHHNDVLSWADIKAAGIVGVIHKATEGTSYVDDTYLDRCGPAYDAGLCWGAYHFANNSDVARQVDNFLSVVGVDDETLYALDWEEDPDGDTMTLDQARQFIEMVDARVGANRCVLYSGNTAKEALGNSKDEFFGAHRLWLAQYGSSPSCQVSWDNYWLWQYSDGVNGPGPHGCPGVSGDVDTNSYAGSDSELRAQWTGATPQPQPPQPRPPDQPAVVMINARGNVRVVINGRVVEV